ncbi:hypothetical protein BV898_00641 [Hypsibius exemplaris]|uniref:Receptor ligand binding region domain-containing protein n=1 Tax=Hypsibius exemplaris TaxID=2072580 RepID=A0A1W0XEB6_HYPEX|nr:hypothetical protein BV898_00641 [Hypsibius exemplaris]
MVIIFPVIIFLSICCSVVQSSPLDVTVVVVGSYQYKTAVPAIEAAAELVNRKYFPYLSMNVSVLLYPQFYDCDAYTDNIANLAARNYYEEAPSSPGARKIYIGPTCFSEALNIATLMNELDVFPSVGTDSRISDKKAFPTTVTCSATHHTVLVRGFRALLAAYNWTTVFLVCDDRPDVSYYRAICRNFQAPTALGVGVRVNSVTFNSASPTMTFDGLLSRAKAASRVIFLSMHMPLTRDFVVHAKRSNMTTADYVYFCSWPSISPGFPEMRWQTDDGYDTDAWEAFRQLFILTFDNNRTLPQEDDLFARRRSASIYNYTYGQAERMSAPVVSGYEATLVIAQVLNESLSEGGSGLSDARALTRRFFNRTFATPTGSVYVNENGDRFPELVVLQLSLKTEYFETVFKYQAATLGASVVNDSIIRWISGKPPSGKPGKCGFDEKSCSTRGSLLDIWTAVGVTIVLLIGAEIIRRILAHDMTAKDRWWHVIEHELVAPMQPSYRATYHLQLL